MARTKKTKTAPAKLACGNCGGGLMAEYDADGCTLLCPSCCVRVAGPFDAAGDIPEYKVSVRAAVQSLDIVAKLRGVYADFQAMSEGDDFERHAAAVDAVHNYLGERGVACERADVDTYLCEIGV